MTEVPEMEDEPGYLQKSLEEADEGMEVGRHERIQPYTEAHWWSVEDECGRKWILPQSPTDAWTLHLKLQSFTLQSS